MKFRCLGNTGLKVSNLCLGTMTFGSKFYNIAAVDQRAADAMVTSAIEAGINFFDTADMYSYGESEQILGQSLKTAKIDRDAVVIATKVRAPLSEAAAAGSGDVNNVGLSRKHIIAACDNSLRRLGTDYIDLYQVHGWDNATPLEETLRALEDLVRHGKVRYLGCSNWSARHLAAAVTLADMRLWERFVSLQTYYSLVGRDIEHELLPLCVEQGLGVLPWSPLAGGFLTGKYRKGESGPQGARRTDFDFPPIDDPRAYDAVEVLAKVAETQNASIAQVALSWLLHQPAVTSVLIGAKNMHQLQANLASAEVELLPEQLAELNAVTLPPVLYPQWMIERQNQA